MREFWEENGYVLVPNAAPLENLEAVKRDIFEFLGGSRDEPNSWYVEVQQDGSPVSAYGKGGMVQMFQTQGLWNNRQHPRIHRAFAELYDTEELVVSIDRANLKPPQRPQNPGWGEAGTMHWDMPPEQLGSPKMPEMVRIQGVLYLEDTPANGGGFVCVPKFHKEFGAWVSSIPEEDRGKNFSQQPSLAHLQPVAIEGKAGDLVSAFTALTWPFNPHIPAAPTHPAAGVGVAQSGTRSSHTATARTRRRTRGSHSSSRWCPPTRRASRG
jgi:hypothetical protein